jgi:hypothetical protein
VAECSGSSFDTGVEEANARLIASAPDLLDALQAMFDERGRDPQKVVAMCKAAISKATGESNA